MKINNFMPNLYNNNIEMNAIINSEEVEFENSLKFNIRTSFDNNFIATADSYGLTNFEKLFNLTSNPNEESLDFRRQRLWNRINSNPIYTERYLQQCLNDILGVNNYRYVISYNDYTLDIYATRPGKLWLKELKALLEKIMPCNILWTIHLYQIIWQAVKDNTTTWQDLIDKNLTWEDVLGGEWINE